MSGSAVPCAAWCMMTPVRCDGTECYYHPDNVDVPAMLATVSAAAYGEGDAYVGLTLGRVLSSEFRYGAVPDSDSCVIGIGVGRHGFDAAEEMIDLTVPEARELIRRLTELCALADADATAVRGGSA